MASATADLAVPVAEPTLRERVGDTARRVAHMSHEARMLKSIATDAVEDGVYNARRAMKSARRDFDDARDAAAHRIKQQPLKTVGAAFGIGLFVGAVAASLAWFAVRPARRTQP